MSYARRELEHLRRCTKGADEVRRISIMDTMCTTPCKVVTRNSIVEQQGVTAERIWFDEYRDMGSEELSWQE